MSFENKDKPMEPCATQLSAAQNLSYYLMKHNDQII